MCEKLVISGNYNACVWATGTLGLIEIDFLQIGFFWYIQFCLCLCLLEAITLRVDD